MHPHERVPYSPITERPKLTLPDGKHVAVWVIVNVEEWSPFETMPRTVLTPPAGGVPTPDVPNWAWHEYGNRVGFWRMAEALDSVGAPAALAINGQAIETYPQITTAALQRDWEFVGHGFTQKNMQKVEDEAGDIAATADAIEKATGRRPRGWLGPGLTETWKTPEHVKGSGYEYLCDWVLDDQPLELQTENGPLTSVPYTQECNDVAMMLIQHHQASEYRQRAIDQYEQVYADAKRDDSARVVALVVHPYIMGAPHRARYFREALEHISGHEGSVFMTGSQIVDWYREQTVATA